LTRKGTRLICQKCNIYNATIKAYCDNSACFPLYIARNSVKSFLKNLFSLFQLCCQMPFYKSRKAVSCQVTLYNHSVIKYICVTTSRNKNTTNYEAKAMPRRKYIGIDKYSMVHFCGQVRSGGGGCGHARGVWGGYIPPATHTIFPISFFISP